MLDRRRFGAGLAAVLAAPLAGWTQEPLSPKGPQLEQKQTQRWQVGVVITAAAPCAGVFATAPVPTDWPEQTVRIVKEEISAQVKAVTYRELSNGVKQMLVAIPQLTAGETAQALVTFEVTRSSIAAPPKTDIFRLPKSPPKEIRPFLLPSPSIESKHSKIKKVAKELVAEEKPAWETVEAIYDWVREHVEYKNGDLKGALKALEDGNGDCEELTSLFIAICRANNIPARTVWIPGHCYPEFYLEDDEGRGHWIPCQAAGTRAFGSMPEFRPVLQKGDNFKVPEKKQPQRYVAEFLEVKSLAGSPPKVRFVRELLPAE